MGACRHACDVSVRADGCSRLSTSHSNVYRFFRTKAEILATGVSSKNEWSAACLDAINTYYGRGEPPEDRDGSHSVNGVALGTFPGPGFLLQSAYNEQVARVHPGAGE